MAKLKTQWITLRVDPETKSYVHKMALQRDIPDSQFILDLVEKSKAENDHDDRP
jgi:hypothetical protein